MYTLGFVSFMLGLSAFILVGAVILFGVQKDHTHTPTGIQYEAEVCVAGEAAIDYNLSTARPFIVCGKISSMGVEEVAPLLGSDTHLAQ